MYLFRSLNQQQQVMCLFVLAEWVEVTRQWSDSRMRPSCHTQDRSRWVFSHSSAGRAPRRNTAGESRSTPGTAPSAASYPAGRQNIQRSVKNHEASLLCSSKLQRGELHFFNHRRHIISLNRNVCVKTQFNSNIVELQSRHGVHIRFFRLEKTSLFGADLCKNDLFNVFSMKMRRII